jgi:hypothetical protein
MIVALPDVAAHPNGQSVRYRQSGLLTSQQRKFGDQRVRCDRPAQQAYHILRGASRDAAYGRSQRQVQNGGQRMCREMCSQP